MRRTSLIVLSFLLIFCGCLAQQNNKEQGKVAQKSTETTNLNSWDFGKVKAGDIVTHEFILANDSKKPLTIQEVNTSCGCTASQARKKNLFPGESTVIEVKFDSKDYSGETQQFIYVHTDSLDNPVSRFIIKADVQK